MRITGDILPRQMKPILTAHVGGNAEMFAEVARLYLRDGQTVADVTHGNGVFWKSVDTSRFNFRPSDLFKGPAFLDFKELPYKAGSMDVVVFDPPYMEGGQRGKVKGSISSCYGNNGSSPSTFPKPTSGLKYHAAVVRVYEEGMKEAARVLRPGGLLWVKCQDEVESHKQKRTHIEVYQIALGLGLSDQDLFVLTQSGTPTMRHKTQSHARKNNSYLWIFKKGD